LALLLTACLTVAYMDRAVLNLLAQPIKNDLGLSDTRLSLLQGFAFTISFMVATIPAGWLADRMTDVQPGLAIPTVRLRGHPLTSRPQGSVLMPVYRFQILDHRLVTPLVEARYAGIQGAQDEAVRFAAEMLKEHPRQFWSHRAWSVACRTRTALSCSACRCSLQRLP
jgi:hypothetical protein